VIYAEVPSLHAEISVQLLFACEYKRIILRLEDERREALLFELEIRVVDEHISWRGRFHKDLSSQQLFAGTISRTNFFALAARCTSGIKVTGNDNEREIAAKRIWRNADAVCFDVDSTVCQDEAIDQLANFIGVGGEIAKCTQRAMNGLVTFREALTQRLAIMRPTYDQLETFAMTHPPLLTPGIRELVAELRRRQIDVYLVSGGFRRLILPAARLLNIPKENVFANEILFDEHGNYADFDRSELTSDSGSKVVGKPGVCGLLKRREGYENLVMIGDGATDMEASPPADTFIGFAGNQCRESVKRGAPWLVYDFDTLRRQLH
uniref:Phosphoserine phosphatase n=1 Tax=Parascaris univalens TaxID=6257 RepID=A0A915BFH5_PARUN